MFVVLM